MLKKTVLTFHPSSKQWGFTLQHRWVPMHCGERFGIVVTGRRVGCRLEMDRDWYVELADDIRFILHPRTAYTVYVDA